MLDAEEFLTLICLILDHHRHPVGHSPLNPVSSTTLQQRLTTLRQRVPSTLSLYSEIRIPRSCCRRTKKKPEATLKYLLLRFAITLTGPCRRVQCPLLQRLNILTNQSNKSELTKCNAFPAHRPSVTLGSFSLVPQFVNPPSRDLDLGYKSRVHVRNQTQL